MKWQGEDSRRIYFYEPHTLVAVESAYTAKGETRTSRRHVYNTETGTSEYIDPASVSVISGDKTVVSPRKHGQPAFGVTLYYHAHVRITW